MSLNFERDAPDTVFNSLKATYYKSSYIKSKQIYPAYLYTATINNNKTGGSGGIKILYPYRKEIWTPTGQDVSKARRLPKKSTRILIKPFYGKIEMNSVGQVRGDKSMRRQVGQTETPYDKHKHIRAIGY